MSVRKPTSFEAWGYSDDCAGMTGVDDDEYKVGRSGWYDFEVDDVVVGQCRMLWRNGGWVFQIKTADGHVITAKKRRRVRG